MAPAAGGPGVGADPLANRTAGPLADPRAAAGRDRYGQGPDREPDPPGQRPAPRAVPQGERGGSSGDAPRLRAVRTRAWRLHRCGAPATRPVRARLPGHAAPRRDRRPACRVPGEAAPGPRRRVLPQGGGGERAELLGEDHRRHPPAVGEADGRRPVPARPLPSAGRPDRSPTLAPRAPGEHPGPGEELPGGCAPPLGGPPRRAPAAAVARQRPGAAGHPPSRRRLRRRRAGHSPGAPRRRAALPGVGSARGGGEGAALAPLLGSDRAGPRG